MRPQRHRHVVLTGDLPDTYTSAKTLFTLTIALAK